MIRVRMLKALICALILVCLAVPGGADATHDAAYDQAVAQFESGDYESALAGFSAMLDVGDSRRYAAWIEGYQALMAEDLEYALTCYEALHSRGFLDSGDMAAYVRARICERDGDLSGAIEIYAGLDVLDSLTRQIDLTRKQKSATPAPTPEPTPAPAPAGTDEAVVTMNGVRRALSLSSCFVQAASTGEASFLHLNFMQDHRDLWVNLPVDMASGDVIDQSSGKTSIGWLYGLRVYDHNFSPFREYDAGNSIHSPYDADPPGAVFRVRLDEVSADGYRYKGSFSGTLLDESGNALTLSDGSFCVTLEAEDVRDVRAGGPLATPTPKPAPTPAAAFYPTLVRGDEGAAVTRLQERLLELGFLRDQADGSYGALTQQAIKDFQSASGLSATGLADSATQNALYNRFAARYTEPEVALIVKRPTSMGEWKKVSGNKMKFRIEVQNISKSKTIKAFELYCYPVDVYGDNLLGDDWHYYATTTKRVQPGKSVKSDYFTLDDRSRIDRIYCGVKQVVYADGSTARNDEVDYANWTITW